MGSWDWHDDAACAGEDLYLFFGGRGEAAGAKQSREMKARAICAGCPVRGECLDFALTRPEKYGVWGGLNDYERSCDRRRRQRRGDYQAGPVEPPKVDKKLCRRCKQVLEAEEFPRDKRSGDGLNSRCKPCSNEAERERREDRRAVAS